jgi:hypothetical protein
MKNVVKEEGTLIRYKNIRARRNGDKKEAI